MQGQQVAQRVARQLDRDVFLVKPRIGQAFAQRTFKLAHIGAHIFGNKKCHFFWHFGALSVGFVDQDRHPHLEFRRLQGHGEPGVKARHQPLGNVHQALGIGVAGHHDVRPFGEQGLKGIEEFFLGPVFVRKELDVVDQQQVQGVVFLFELVKGLPLVGLNHI